MNHIRKAERRLSETAAYRYIIGAVMKLLELTVRGLKWLWRHINDVLTVASVTAMLTVAQAFEDNAITFNIAILFITVLAVLLFTLIKIKIEK